MEFSFRVYDNLQKFRCGGHIQSYGPHRFYSATQHHHVKDDRLGVTEELQTPEQEDWRDKVNLGKKYADHRPRVLELLQPFESMWSGHLGTIKATEHRIELLPGSKPVHQPPYRAGPTQRKIEQKEIEEMLKKESSSRLTQTGLLPWCWYQRPTGPSVSVSTTEDSTP